MRSVLATSLVAVTLSAGAALAQEEISLGWYENNWEATTFPTDGGGWECSVDSRADNLPDSDGAWVFVFPQDLQFAPNTGLPTNAAGRISVDDAAPVEMEIYEDYYGLVSGPEGLSLLQAIARGTAMTIEVWPADQPSAISEYVYSLNGFREAYVRIASECEFDPSPVLDAPLPTPAPAEEPSTGSSLFGRDKHH